MLIHTDSVTLWPLSGLSRDLTTATGSDDTHTGDPQSVLTSVCPVVVRMVVECLVVGGGVSPHTLPEGGESEEGGGRLSARGSTEEPHDPGSPTRPASLLQHKKTSNNNNIIIMSSSTVVVVFLL